MAIIVDHTLSGLGNISLGDYSAQMVMYGKALERCLRDCLYSMISSDEELGAFIISPNMGGISFSSIQCKKTMIGNYTTIIEKKNERFSSMCCDFNTNITLTAWQEWWSFLNHHINNARDLRNKSDHAGESTPSNEIPKMVQLLFGEDGIFYRLMYIQSLHRTYMAQNTSRLLNTFDETHTDYSEKKLVQFTYTRPLENKANQKINGVFGYIESECNKALLHISQMKSGFVTSDEMNKFINYCNNQKNIQVKIIGKDQKGYQVSLIGISPSFDSMIS